MIGDLRLLLDADASPLLLVAASKRGPTGC
jgi:hypothetical protein